MIDPKLPYMPLYVHDIESSRYCRKMTDANFGRYMRILIRQWVEGHVDADPVEVVKDAMLDHGSEESVAEMLDARFPLNENGVRLNLRCAEIRNETLAKVEVNRTNGRRGGRPPKNPTVNRNETHGFQLGLAKQNPTAKQSESESESESENPPLPPTGGNVVCALLGRMGVAESERDSFASIDGMTPCHAVAVWRSVTADGSVKQVWRAVAGKLRKSGIDGLAALDPDAVCAAVKAGIVHRIGDVDVQGVPLKRNAIGVYIDHGDSKTCIAKATDLKSWAVSLA